jgi:hypothetical protein
VTNDDRLSREFALTKPLFLSDSPPFSNILSNSPRLTRSNNDIRTEYLPNPNIISNAWSFNSPIASASSSFLLPLVQNNSSSVIPDDDRSFNTQGFKNSIIDDQMPQAQGNSGEVTMSSAVWVGVGVALVVLALVLALVVRRALARSKTEKSQTMEVGMEFGLEADDENEQVRLSLSHFGTDSVEICWSAPSAQGHWSEAFWQFEGKEHEEVKF